MKAFVFALLCVVAAVQARSADFGVLSLTPAQAGENPWVVHLRVAKVNGEGLLHSCIGSLISEAWVLTTASCVEGLRFVWLRYGALNPITPELVTESSQFTINEDNNLALINLTRVLETNENIAPIALAEDEDMPATGKFCGYGAESNVLKDEELSCFELLLEADEDGNIVGVSDVLPSQYDIGAPIVSDGVQVGVLTSVSEDNVENIAPIALAEDEDMPATGKFCGYGAESNVLKDEELSCFELLLEADEDGNIVGVSDVLPSQYDIGAPIVSDGVQVGVLTSVSEDNVENIAPIALAEDEDMPATGKFCGYGAESNVLKDEELSCFELLLEADEDGNIVGVSDVLPSQYDIGAPIVSDGVQVGVLTSVSEDNVENIAPIALAEDEDMPATGKFCGYGAESNVLKDEELSCFELLLEADEDGNIVGVSDVLPSQYDIGAPIVSDGVQVGVLTSVSEDNVVIVNPAKYRDWIESVSGVRV